jgi:hypothetical protein
MIRRWWERHPDANIGGATEASGVLAVDLDMRDGKTLKRKLGVENWAAIAPEGEPGVQHLTASDGFHLMWRGDHGVRPSNGQVAESVDVKSQGVVHPPARIRDPRGRVPDGGWSAPPENRGQPRGLRALRAVATSRKAKAHNTAGER